MPDIDISDLTLDSDIAGETFTVLRRQQVMQTNGVPLITTTLHDAVGAIFPAGDNTLVRQEAFEHQQNAVKVITTFRLRGASRSANGDQFLPDLIQRANGDTYIVHALNEWTKFGAGFIEADCVSFDFNQPAPT